jgi:hypothetical protein
VIRQFVVKFILFALVQQPLRARAAMLVLYIHFIKTEKADMYLFLLLLVQDHQVRAVKVKNPPTDHSRYPRYTAYSRDVAKNLPQ